MKTTIFVRILLATLLPLILVFILVISTINNIVYMHGRTYAREATEMAARQAAKQISDKLAGMSRLLSITSQSLSELDYSSPEALKLAEDYQRRLIVADPSFYSAWMAFNPGILNGGDGYYHRTLIQKRPGQIFRIHDLTDEVLSNPEKSPWYNYPLSTRQPYLNMADFYDYGQGHGYTLAATMSYPIVHKGRAIGGIGLDIMYDELFNPETLKLAAGQKTLLLSKDGMILYSDNHDEVGHKLLDYTFSDSEKLATSLDQGTGIMEEMDSPFSGGQSLVALYPITLENGEISYLFASVPLNNLYGSTQNSMRLIVSTSILGALLLAFSVFVATRSIVRPIRQLTVNFNKVANGDLDLDLAAEDQGGSSSDFADFDDDEGETEQADDDDDDDSGWDLDRENDDYDEDEDDDSPDERERDTAAEDDPHESQSSNVVEIDILQSALRKMLTQISQAHEMSLKAAEEQLEKEKVMASSQAQSRFFASMSHEIRTPMNAILGISEILLHGDELKGQQRKYINDIKLSSESLLIIINDILDLSKLESGKMSLSPIDFNLKGLLDNISSLARYLASDKQLEFSAEIADGLPLCLYGDDVRLRQVLLNILSNAIKFTRQGSVRLKVFIDDEGFIRYTITDTGIGIKQEDQSRLFEPFKQMDTTRNREIQGTGLGLSISRSLVELMGGRIDLKSEYGQGSVFTVILPVVPGDEKKCADLGMEIAAVTYVPTLRALVVDDNAINRSVAAGLLKTIHGIEPDLAASGREALDMVRDKDYHLIFMDHMMPEMDGVETTTHIRAMGGKFLEIPIIALTANAVVGTREMLLQAGMNDFLAKPILKKELGDILYRWVPADQRLAAESGAEPDMLSAAQEDHQPEVKEAGTSPEPEDSSDDEYTDFLTRMAAIDDIDLAVALDAVADQVDIYYELLDLLSEKVPEMIELLTGLLAEENLKEFSIHVHGMKSSLASAGAMSLSRQARNLEAASATGDLKYCRDNLTPFVEQLAELGRRLNKVYGR
ncbi:hypothetical protein C4J81_04460 [Deltaproteobacteria bacterium Smac51]|nr:hypothetical protein C4J81_04460 [Deltaproteobacteria bacterium Smac51]